ncbi:MAG: hypothetical protein JXP37_10345 [Coriobacteriia bacterium]|nr:hypothetical protein [Coriobacteriia bacterium]
MQEYVPYIIIGAVAAALIVGTVVVARIAWRRQVGRYIITLTSHREAVASALKTAESVIATLAVGDTAQVVAFTTSGSEDRQTFGEVAERMRIEQEELKDIALPKALWKLADMLCAAAGSLATQAGSVGEGEGEVVLDALLSLDLGPARRLLADATAEAERVSTLYKVTEASVYGGGLYI